MKIRKLFGILFALLLMAGLLSAGQTVFAAETYTIEMYYSCMVNSTDACRFCCRKW